MFLLILKSQDTWHRVALWMRSRQMKHINRVNLGPLIAIRDTCTKEERQSRNWTSDARDLIPLWLSWGDTWTHQGLLIKIAGVIFGGSWDRGPRSSRDCGRRSVFTLFVAIHNFHGDFSYKIVFFLFVS